MTMPSLPRLRALPILLALGLVTACTSQSTILPSRDLDRPTDLTFVCMGAFGSAADGGGAAGAAGLVTSGRPMGHCHSRNMLDPPPDAQHRTFGFMPNSANGLLSVVDADNWKLVDLDLSIAGFNQYPLGRVPTQLVSSDDGCRMFSTNRGSCDLTMVNPAALMQPTLAREIPGLPTATPPEAELGKTIQPTRNGKPLQLIPQEVALLPRDTSQLVGDTNLCTDAWTGQAIVTFPSCNLIALVDLPSGEIVDGLYVRRLDDGGVRPVPIGAALDCPVSDCQPPVDGGTSEPADAGDAGAPDAGAPLPVDGGPVAPVVLDELSPRPGPIAIVPGGNRAYVGLVDAPAILAIELLTPNKLVPARDQQDKGVIKLNGGAVGTTRLRLSIDPYAPLPGAPGFAGKYVGGAVVASRTDRRYLYAIARDGTLRVVHVGADPEQECETNVDQTKYSPAELQSACLSVDPTKRRPGLPNPGLRFPAPPVDIAAADVASSAENADHSETSVAGAHAWVLAANGTVYLVNIDPVERSIRYVEPDGRALMCQTPTSADCFSEPPPVPNTVRNRNFMSYSPTLGPNDGPPRLDFPVSQQQSGPQIEAIWTRGTADNATADTSTNPSPYIQTQVFFPDPSSALTQPWAVSWEGALLGPRASGQIVDGPPGAVALSDPGIDFCRQGMQERDLVTLTGCTTDVQCGMGNTCRKGSEGTIGAGNVPITGLCIAKTADKGICDNLLSTVRRYEVTIAGQTKLTLRPRMDELILPDLAPCVPGNAGGTGDGGAPADGGAEADGGSGADGAGGGGDHADGCFNPNDPSTDDFVCVPYKRPEATASENRCLMPCTQAGQSDNCRAGRLCVSFAVDPAHRVTYKVNGVDTPPCTDPGECFCADGPDLAIPPNSTNKMQCFDELLPYQLQVGRGFLVQGAVTGIQVTRRAGAAGLCENDPSVDPRIVMRIPMSAPHCANVADNTLDSRCNPKEVGSCPNPEATALALRDVARTTGAPNPCLYNGGPNETDPTMQSPSHVHALFRNEQVQFTVTNLELPVSGTYQMKFEVRGGFRSQTVYNPPTVEVGMPARIVLGPFDAQVPTETAPNAPDVPYLFVVDQLRLGRTAGGGKTRGQLLRIQPRGQAITTPVPGSQPWFEDFVRSGELFPIQ